MKNALRVNQATFWKKIAAFYVVRTALNAQDQVNILAYLVSLKGNLSIKINALVIAWSGMRI